MFGFLPNVGKYQAARQQTATAGTAIAVLFPPMVGAYTHVSDLVVTAGSTAHSVWILRPLNTTTLSAAATSEQAVVALAADPSQWNAAYQYPLLNSGPNGTVAGNSPPVFQTANGSLTAGDYLVFQTPDGAFWFSTISSVSTLNVTLTSNVPAGGLAAGATVWYMGQASSGYIDPATAQEQYNRTLTVSIVNKFPDLNDGEVIQTLHPNDPLLLYDANSTVADVIESFAGYYAKY